MDARGEVNYYGPMYIGSEYRESRMIYDTTSQWVTVDEERIPNALLISNYDV